MSERLIAIGDIHGCADALEKLIDLIQPTEEDHLVPLGDFVDRGTDSKRVVDLLIDLSQRCRCEPLLGNHEIMMLDAVADSGLLSYWLAYGGRETLDSYGGSLSDIPDSHLEFLDSCLRFVEVDEYFFVHANYDSRVPLASQTERFLFWEHLSTTLPAPHQSGKIAVVGHTPQMSGQVLDLGFLLCLDTFCVGNGWLTAMEFPTRAVWQVSKSGSVHAKPPT